MNVSIKEAKKLISSHYRKKVGLALIEGEKVIKSVIEDGASYIKQIYVSEEKPLLFDVYSKIDTLNVSVISKKDVNDLRQTKGTQGLFAVVIPPEKKEVEHLKEIDENIVIFDSISNPDNLGAMIRTALAFGWSNFVFVGSSVSMSNNTLVRASSGYIYKGSYYYVDYTDIDLFTHDKNIYIADLNGVSPHKTKILNNRKNVIIMGNEGNGISKYIYEKIKNKKNIITLEMSYCIDSISVAHASAILFYLLK